MRAIIAAVMGAVAGVLIGYMLFAMSFDGSSFEGWLLGEYFGEFEDYPEREKKSLEFWVKISLRLWYFWAVLGAVMGLLYDYYRKLSSGRDAT
jgi:hypothetical protein